MYTYKIVPEKKLVIMVFSEIVDFKEIMKANTYLSNEPEFNKNFSGVVDHRKSELKLTIEEICAIAESVSRKNITVGKWVILVSKPETTAFSTIYAENIRKHHPQNICTTIKAAEKYLDIDLADHLEKSLFD